MCENKRKTEQSKNILWHFGMIGSFSFGFFFGAMKGKFLIVNNILCEKKNEARARRNVDIKSYFGVVDDVNKLALWLDVDDIKRNFCVEDMKREKQSPLKERSDSCLWKVGVKADCRSFQMKMLRLMSEVFW